MPEDALDGGDPAEGEASTHDHPGGDARRDAGPRTAGRSGPGLARSGRRHGQPGLDQSSKLLG
jgi:hypothetical protein